MTKLAFPCSLVALALLSACGDARSNWIGDYTTSDILTTTNGGVSTNSQVSTDLNITDNADAKRINLTNGTCTWTAVVAGRNATLDPTTCTTSGSNTAGATCTITLTYVTAVGTESGGTVTLPWSGTQSASCSDGTNPSGTFTESITGSIN